jgi:hypothetical protein
MRFLASLEMTTDASPKGKGGKSGGSKYYQFAQRERRRFFRPRIAQQQCHSERSEAK